MHRALYIEPTQPPSESPVLDSLTRRAAFALSRCRMGQGWRGFHTCACGAQSSANEHILRAIIGEIETNSLMVHYLAHHRAECPTLELQALELILPKDELEPTPLMLRGWRYGERYPQAGEHPWLQGLEAHLAEWPERLPPAPEDDVPPAYDAFTEAVERYRDAYHDSTLPRAEHEALVAQRKAEMHAARAALPEEDAR